METVAKTDRDIISQATSNMVEGGWSSFYSVMGDLYELNPRSHWFMNEDDYNQECCYCGEIFDTELKSLPLDPHGDPICDDCLKENFSE